MGDSLLPHLGKIEHIKKVHSAQDQHHNSKLRRNIFNSLNEVGRLLANAKKQKDESYVDQVKTNDQEVIHRISHLLIARKSINQKYPTIFVEGASNPNSHAKTDKKIRNVDAEASIHSLV
jgi:hypothetical protein